MTSELIALISIPAVFAYAWQIARMSGFTIYLLMAPLLAVASGLVIFWLTGWLDRRDERRHRAAE
jgi:hypothetical protein